MEYIVLIITWVGWCAMHSILVSAPVTGLMQARFPGYTTWYRLCYNSFSLITLAVPVGCLKMIDDDPVFIWEGLMQLPRFILLLLALVLFREGAKKYDLGYFLGIKQLKTGRGKTLLGDQEGFTQAGVFGIIRHPWYAGSLLLIWSGFSVYAVSTMITAVILSIYLVTGTFLEERKILAEYGQSYQDYQQDVSMLFPWKWIVRRINGFLSHMDL